MKHSLMLYYCFYEKWALLDPGTKRASTDLCHKITQIWHFVNECRDLFLLCCNLNLSLSKSKYAERLNVVISESAE